MNLDKEVDPIYIYPSQTILTITKEQWELENAKVARLAKLEMLNVMDEESRDKLRNKGCLQYDKKGK
jgi:hypothetical protein